MEKRLTKKAEGYSDEVKESILSKLIQLKPTLDNDEQRHHFDDVVKCINSIKPLTIVKEDLLKRKRTRNNVSLSDRCCACRANGEQCSRRKREGYDFCGTHIKGTPHGVVENTVFDTDTTVFNNVINPAIISKCNLVDGKYSIKTN